MKYREGLNPPLICCELSALANRLYVMSLTYLYSTTQFSTSSLRKNTFLATRSFWLSKVKRMKRLWDAMHTQDSSYLSFTQIFHGIKTRSSRGSIDFIPRPQKNLIKLRSKTCQRMSTELSREFQSKKKIRIINLIRFFLHVNHMIILL